jgi:formylglycine-generating enzyme required for sulfatase activity
MPKYCWLFSRLSRAFSSRPKELSFGRRAAGFLVVLMLVTITGFRSIASDQAGTVAGNEPPETKKLQPGSLTRREVPSECDSEPNGNSTPSKEPDRPDGDKITREGIERLFDLLDTDKNDEMSEDEFNRSVLVRLKFRRAEITPTFPIARDVFLKIFPKTSKDRPLPLTVPFDSATAKAAQEAWAKSIGKSGPIEKNAIGIELVLIPAGKFRMGRPPSGSDGGSQINVTLTKGFYLGKTEITQGQWQAVMGTTPWKGMKGVREGADFPACYVTWDDAQQFCKKLSDQDKTIYRLPSEAQWEFACRAGTTTRFYCGDDESTLNDYAWWGAAFGSGSAKVERYAHSVATKKPNPFGLYDMHGNVAELCEDFDGNQLPGGIDPVVTRGGTLHVVRGGTWGNLSTSCRSWYRGIDSPNRGDFLGFRITRNLE